MSNYEQVDGESGPSSSRVKMPGPNIIVIARCRGKYISYRPRGCLVHSSAATMSPAKAQAMTMSPTITDTKDAIVIF